MEFSAKDFPVATGLSPYLSCDNKVYTPEELAEFNKYIEDVESKATEFVKEKKDTPFGHSTRDTFFSLDPSVRYLNHGSFGAVLKHVTQAKTDYVALQEKNPWRFLEPFHQYGLGRANQFLSKLVGCDASDLVFLPNATSCISSVLRSIPLTENDSILITNLTYAAVKKAVHAICTEKGSKIVYVDITAVVGDSSKFIELIKNSLKSGIKYAIFDHIISETATITPVKELVELCHKNGIVAIIDGAHAVGQIPLDMHSLDADYYCSNAHKWLCSGRGCAFLYTSKKMQKITKPTNISHGYPYGYQSEFVWLGTDDYTAYISLPVAIQFYQTLGVEKIMKRNHELIIEAAHLCAKSWNTKLLCDDEHFGSMALIELPPMKFALDGKIAFELRNFLFTKYKIVSPIIWIAGKGKMYVRISGQIYNQLSDYEHLIEAIKEIQQLSSLN